MTITSLSYKRIKVILTLPEDKLPLTQNQKSPLKSGDLGEKQKEASITNPNTIIWQTSQTLFNQQLFSHIAQIQKLHLQTFISAEELQAMTAAVITIEK